MDQTTHKDYTECDVLVVGAGPAGCTAAHVLARQGVSVALLDKRSSADSKICGDLLGPRSLKLLGSLGLLDAAVLREGRVIDSVKIYDDRRLLGWSPIYQAGPYRGYGVALERSSLDRWLREKACTSGAHLLEGHQFVRIERYDERGILSLVHSEEGKKLFLSKLVLGADGVHSTVARESGLLQRNPQKMIFAVRCYYTGVADVGSALELYFLPHIMPGYGWLIPMEDGRANIGLGIRADMCLRQGKSIRSHFYDFLVGHPVLATKLKEAHRASDVKGWPIGLYGQAWKNYAPHVLILGDAGSFADPLSGEGIYGAVESARLAAATALEALVAGRFDEGFLGRYERRWRGQLQDDLGRADRLVSLPYYNAIMSKLAFWAIRRMTRRGLRDLTYARKVTGLFSGELPRKEALTPRFIIKTLVG